MPLLTGPLANGGAVIDVFVAVGESRAALLRKHGFPVPPPVPVRALVDTGSHLTGFAVQVFRSLDIQPYWATAILTPSTQPASPHPCDIYIASLSFLVGGIAHPIFEGNVLATDGFRPDEDVQGLIGLDILAACQFNLVGPLKAFTLAF
jgi:hypothetical protein